MEMLVTFIKEWNGRIVGDGVHFDEAEAASLINRGIVMESTAWLKMQEDKKEHAKEMRHAREDKPKITPKAPEAPKKDKMVRSPVKKKASTSKAEPAEPVMRWRS
jgi:hypothetical protein